MSLALSKYVSAMAAGLTTSVVGIGGVEPYTYAVLAGGAGGTINASTGFYTAPAALNSDPKKALDYITVTDSLSATAQGSILVTNTLGLFTEIIQREMGLDNAHIYWWDQKLPQPNDSSVYIAVSMERLRPFGNNKSFDADFNSVQTLNVMATLGIDVISRSNEALFRKEEVLLALASDYSQFQQNANSFNIGRLPSNSDFINLSVIDGAAIPYRFRISVNMQYVFTKTQTVPYFDTFQTPEVTINP